MRARFRFKEIRTIGLGLGLLLVVLLGLAQTGTPPEITFIDFPSEIPADGSEITGYVGFKDKDGDIATANFEVVKAEDFQPFSLDLRQFKGYTEGVFMFTIATTTPQQVTLRLTLIDEAGNRSEPKEFSFAARGALADLVVSLEQVPAQVFVGAALEAQARITNQGVLDSGPFRAGLYLSPDAEVTPEDLLLGSKEILNLAPGASTLEILRAAIPEDLFKKPGFQPGEMYLGVIADDTDRVRESNEKNNVASAKLRVEERPPIPPPVADFTASPTSGVAPLTVQFTNLSKGEITSYHWDFGDGVTSTERDPRHTYQNPGSYTVSLTARGPGGEDTERKPDFIRVSAVPAPVADFTASPTSGPAPLTVRFTNLSKGEITDYHWDFGDGATSTERDPQHTYVNPGSYTVTLTVRGPGGEDTKRKPDFIQVLAARAIFKVVDISVEPRSPKVNETVTIRPTLENTGNARGTDLINLYIDGAFKGSRTLTLDPGGRGSVSFSYTFTEARNYRVEIKTSDDSREIIITVIQPPRPVARFRAEPTSGPPPLTVRFTNLSQNFTSSHWSFGDGSTSTETNPVHTYWAMGSYTVQLTVRGPGGESSTSQVITVLPAPSGLLYQDDFRSPSSGWCTGRSALADYAYESGEYSITVKRPHWLYWCWAPREHSFPEDFIVEVEAGQVSGPSGEYGIIWGKDSDNFYMFAVSTDGRYGMWKQVRDAWQPNPVNWTASSAINRGTGKNHLRLIVKGNTIVLIANDVVLQTVTESSFGRGRIGLFVGTWDTPGIEVHFDNFKVYSVP